METSRRRAQSQKRATRHSSQLTVMVSKGVGKVRSFKISYRILLCSSVFFASYIIISILVFNGYFDELRASRDQSGRIERIQREIEDTKRELYQSKQRLAFLEDYFLNLKPGGEGQGESFGPETVTQESADPEVTDPPRGSEPAQEAGKEGPEVGVKIKDLNVKKKGTRLTVSFKLARARPNGRALSGYVHIIAINRGSDSTQFWTYPKVALRNGLPVNYKHGEPFTIRKFKTIRGRYFFDSKSEFPSCVKVLIYSQPGKLILQEEFEILDS